MPVKKSELYSSIWESCDELRGGMDASQYKDYVLVLLFVKYISDKYAGKPYAQIKVPKGASFKDMVELKGRTTIGDDINKKIIAKIAEANKLTGIIDVADFDNPEKLGSGQDKVERLTNLIAIFEKPELDFSKNKAEGDDLLGDAYEYLMKHFATESGKSKGQFYTPAEVSRIMAKIIGIDPKCSSQTTVYDPTCGSGSLLLKVADEAESKITLYGQEMDVATRALAKMNTILHDQATAEIERENTVSKPQFLDNDGKLKTFDFAVANPPFSFKSWSNGINPNEDTYDRFKDYSIPPKKNGDYAFLLHLIASLKSKGKGAIILPHGVLFRGNTEADIRKNIIQRGYIKGVIGLPPNLFYGTGIPACIIVLDKENAKSRKGIFMIDASKGFIKDGNKNRLREQDIHKIVDVFNKQSEVPKYSRLISLDEIEKNEFNLNIPRYIDSQEEEDIQDIEAHLLGGIPNRDIEALEKYWNVYPSLKGILFKGLERENYLKITLPKEEIKKTIYSHSEFISYGEKVQKLYKEWKKKNITKLKGIAVGDKPKSLIYDLSEDLLETFSKLSLIDRYDVYQHLLSYWNEVMQDDVYILAIDGWKAGNEVNRKLKESKDKKKKEVEGIEGLEGRLIPPELLIDVCFKEDKESLEGLKISVDSIEQKMEEMKEEHSGEDGLLEEVINEKNNIIKKDIQKRIKEIKDDKDFKDELNVLKEYLSLEDEKTELNKKIKEAKKILESKVVEKYKALAEDEIKKIVVEEKWLKKIEEDINTEMQNISQKLTNRIKELEERYENTLPALESLVGECERKVKAHLEKMEYVF